MSSTRERPRVTLTYCTRCRWLLRAAWLAQELLSTFEAELGEVALVPGETAGIFEVRVEDALVWSRAEEGGFPDAAELKRRVRDRVAPGRDLGHGEARGAARSLRSEREGDPTFGDGVPGKRRG